MKVDARHCTGDESVQSDNILTFYLIFVSKRQFMEPKTPEVFMPGDLD